MQGNIKTAIASLRMTKWRSLLTMLGIIIGVSSVITIVSLGEGLKQQIVGQLNTLGPDVITVRSGKLVSHSSTGQANGLNLLAFFSASTLSTQDVNTLAKLPTVSSVVPFNFVTSTVAGSNREYDSAYVVGTSPALPSVLKQKMAYGTFFDTDSSDQHFAVVGNSIAQNLYGEYNPTGQSIIIRGQSFIIRGVLAPASGGLLSAAQTDFNQAVFIPYSQAETLSEGHTNLLQIMVRAKEASQVTPTIRSIKVALAKNHQQQDFSVLTQYELLKVASGVVGTAAGAISGIAAVSLLVGGIGIMDIMLVSVSERTREIGLRKAIGATNRQILNQFLIEGLVLSIGGGFIGILVAFAANVLLRLYTNWQPIITWPIAVLAIAVSIVVGIVFSIAPALKAARKDPIEALRS